MRGDALGLELKADEAPMRDCDAQVGRLDDDRSVGVHTLDDRLGADRRELLVGDQGHDHITSQPRYLGRGEQDRGKRAFHVIRAASVEAVAVDARLERRLHPRDADGVEVAVQEQRPTIARPALRGDDARALLAENLDLEALGRRTSRRRRTQSRARRRHPARAPD